MIAQTDKPNTRSGNEVDFIVHIRWAQVRRGECWVNGLGIGLRPIGHRSRYAARAIFFSPSDAEAGMAQNFRDEEML